MKFDKVIKPSETIVNHIRTFFMNDINSGVLNKKMTNLSTLTTRDSKSRLTTATTAAVKTEMIRDKFVFGICDDNLKERLLRETDISLSKLVGLAQRTESSKQRIKEMTGATSKSTDAIHENNKQKEILCGQCGNKHRPKECPAFGQQCSICRKLHRFAKVTNVKSLSRTNKLLTVKILQRREFMFLIRKTTFQWQRSFHQCYTGSWHVRVTMALKSFYRKWQDYV